MLTYRKCSHTKYKSNISSQTIKVKKRANVNDKKFIKQALLFDDKINSSKYNYFFLLFVGFAYYGYT